MKPGDFVQVVIPTPEEDDPEHFEHHVFNGVVQAILEKEQVIVVFPSVYQDPNTGSSHAILVTTPPMDAPSDKDFQEGVPFLREV